MGGRGSSGGIAKKTSSDGVIEYGVTRKVETTYYDMYSRGGSRYKDNVMEAKTDGNGNLSFERASGIFEKHAKTNKTSTVTYEISAGSINGETFGVNWDKVKTVSGQTFDMKDEIKKRGFRWDGAGKRWVRK